MHGSQVRAGHPALQAEALRLVGELLDVARQRIVGLVAMHVDHQAALRGDLAELGDRARAVGHGALEMRDAADDIDAEVERADCVFARRRRAVEAVLREGDELQVDIGRDLLLHLEQRLDGEQPVVADVDMGADGEQAHRDRPVAIAKRALLHRLMGEQRLQLAPERNAFEQRARDVDARDAVGERRIHVEMRVDEGRRDEASRRRRRSRPASAGDRRLDGGDRLAVDADIGGACRRAGCRP